MWLLRIYEREEIEDMKISKNLQSLQRFAKNNYGENLTFIPIVHNNINVFIYCNNEEIGVIAKIQEII